MALSTQSANKVISTEDLKKFVERVKPADLTINPEKITEAEEDRLDEAKRQRYLSDTSDRKWLAVWTALVVTIWLICVFGILINNHDRYHLSDTVLNVLLGTTTLNVLGLSFIVLRGHFQSSKDKDFKR